MKKTGKIKNYSALEVANMCGVVNQTAINWIKRSYLQAYTTPGGQYRVYGEELVDFMQKRGIKVPLELLGYLPSVSRKLLLIESDRVFADQIIDDLHAEHPRSVVDHACDSFEAGIKLVGAEWDLVLVNCNMPGLEVRRVCEMVRNSLGGRERGIIVFTDHIDSSEKQVLLEAGADVYIEKPFDIGQISIYLE